MVSLSKKTAKKPKPAPRRRPSRPSRTAALSKDRFKIPASVEQLPKPRAVKIYLVVALHPHSGNRPTVVSIFSSDRSEGAAKEAKRMAANLNEHFAAVDSESRAWVRSVAVELAENPLGTSREDLTNVLKAEGDGPLKFCRTLRSGPEVIGYTQAMASFNKYTRIAIVPVVAFEAK